MDVDAQNFKEEKCCCVNGVDISFERHIAKFIYTQSNRFVINLLLFLH